MFDPRITFTPQIAVHHDSPQNSDVQVLGLLKIPIFLQHLSTDTLHELKDQNNFYFQTSAVPDRKAISSSSLDPPRAFQPPITSFSVNFLWH